MRAKGNGKGQSRKAAAPASTWQTRQLTPEQLAARAALPQLTEEEAERMKAQRLAALESLRELAEQLHRRGVRLQVPEIIDEARAGLP